MTALIISLCVLAFFVILGLMRLAVYVSYSRDGLVVAGYAGIVKITLYPRPEKGERKKKPKKKKKPKEKKKTEAEGEKKSKKGGSVRKIRELLSAAGEALGGLRRRLVIDKLTVRYTSAAGDPFDAAMGFGRASAGMGAVTALIRRFFKVRSLDMQSDVSFEETDPVVYLEAKISIAIWAMTAIGIKFLILFLKGSKSDNNKEKKSDIKNDERKGG
ncbi:MAG: hypothetical protein IKI49_03175 [Oscillospiraceae bacterium]|nr:hypothetical protein [Oscillospiraceae bacterium]